MVSKQHDTVVENIAMYGQNTIITMHAFKLHVPQNSFTALKSVLI